MINTKKYLIFTFFGRVKEVLELMGREAALRIYAAINA